MPVIAGADEREEIVDLLLGEEGVERLQHAVLDEERQLERVDVTQSGERPARACSSRRACSAPMSWLKNSNWSCQSGCASANFCQIVSNRALLLGERAVGGLVGVGADGQHVRRVGLADVVGRHQLLRLRAEGDGGQDACRKQHGSK